MHEKRSKGDMPLLQQSGLSSYQGLLELRLHLALGNNQITLPLRIYQLAQIPRLFPGPLGPFCGGKSAPQNVNYLTRRY